MGFTDVKELAGGNNLDLEILNDLAENDRYLKNIIPDVYVRAANKKVGSSEAGAQMKIQGGHVAVPNFSGKTTIKVNFPIAHNGGYRPVVVTTLFCQVPMTCTITASDSKGFTAKISTTQRGTMRGVNLNWIALTQS